MKLQNIINKPRIRQYIDSLPEHNRLIKLCRVLSKSLLFQKRIVANRRIVFEGIEDAIFQKYLTLGAGSDEVLVESLTTAVSPGTEKGYFSDFPNFHQPRPYIPGYSGCGIIKGVGRNVVGYRKKKVVAGLMKHVAFNVLVPELLVLVPEGVEPHAAAFVTLGVIALTGIRIADITGGEKVAVLGQGVLGQLVDQLVRIQGAGSVAAVALSDAKKAMAEKSGVDEFIALSERDSTLTDLNFDVVIDITGSLKGFESALKMVKPGGRVVMLGSIPTYAEESDWASTVVNKEIEVRGAHVRNLEAEGLTYREEASRFLNLLAAKKIKLDHLITDVYEPDNAPEIYQRLAKGDRGRTIVWGQKTYRSMGVWEYRSGPSPRPIHRYSHTRSQPTPSVRIHESRQRAEVRSGKRPSP